MSLTEMLTNIKGVIRLIEVWNYRRGPEEIQLDTSYEKVFRKDRGWFVSVKVKDMREV